jgi:16S rRNA (guanine527-N7)-methyltransferase
VAAEILTSEAFRAATDVSRETLARLEIYADLLATWQRRINLVGPSTLPDLWRRHMLDSAQLAPLVPGGTRTLLDLGSGAGFPGLVLAILGAAEAVHLVEADARKCAFLREAAVRTGTAVTLHNSRIDAVAPFEADAVTARALAPLPKLLSLAAPFLGPESVCLLHKGARWQDELTEAGKDWIMRADRQVSLTDPNAVILRLTELRCARIP